MGSSPRWPCCSSDVTSPGRIALRRLPQNAVGCFPEHDEGFPHGFILDPSSNGRSIGSDGAFAAKQSNRMLAVTAGHGHELVQVSGLFQFADMLGALT